MNLYKLVMDTIPKIKWNKIRRKLGWKPSGEIWQKLLCDSLDKGYYIILTEDRGALSSWGVKLLHFCLTFTWPRYTHALVNVEETTATKYLFMEAINKGVWFADFNEVFNCDSIVFLSPIWYTQEEFDATVADVYAEIGKDYDIKFNYDDETNRSCVEIARQRMMTLPGYFEKMRRFEYLIKCEKNLTPQMFRDCPDFQVVLEIKR